MSKTLTFTTVEDIVKYVLDHPTDTSRFTMSERSNQVWDNPEDGAAWLELWNNRAEPYWHRQRHDASGVAIEYSDEQLQELRDRQKAIEDEYQAIRPPDHREDTITLEETGTGSRHYFAVVCGVELSAQIKKVWKRKPAYQGSSYTVPTGALLLSTLVKRLGGDADIDKQIKAAKDAIEAQNAKNSRNYHRRELSKKAAEILDMYQKYGAEAGVGGRLSFIQDLQQLVKLADEQEA